MKVYKANNGKKKISALAICLLLTVVMAIGGTLAYLFTSTSPVENTFAPAKVGNYVKETLAEDEGKWEKQNVTIVNNIGGQTGNPEIVDAYIRAMVVANWKTSDNKILPAVRGIDYSITFANGTGWVQNTADGYYYYTKVVKPDGETGVFIKEVKPLLAAPTGHNADEGYTLHVEIISQSIQAEGTDAAGKTPIELAWKVKISGDTVTPVS